MTSSRTPTTFLILLATLCLSISLACAGRGGDDDDSDPVDDDTIDDDGPSDDDNDADDDDDSAQSSALEDLIERMGFLQYIDIEPVREKPAANGYTRYFFDPEDMRCFNGGEANVAVSPGTSNNVMIFLEGGGAAWPGQGFCVQLDTTFDIGIKTRHANNPVRDWNFVYVPYCDCSLHSGDNVVEYDGKTRYHQGIRHLVAAVALSKRLFPHPDKVLVAGSSAGGYGTYYGWLVAKSQYMDSDTYIFNDSGTGFWNPDDPTTFQTIKQAWNLSIPEDCVLCTDTVLTSVYDTYLRYDPRVRIGMFTSYYDAFISGLFLGMEREAFRSEIMSVTDEIKQLHPDRFNRFFIDTTTHTSYELEWCDVFPGKDFFLEPGPDYQLDGTSLFQWIGYLVDGDPRWRDLLE